MDLKELNYVVTVANEGSISRAAEKLFMSQSSLSQAIRVLEQDLGTSVFVRTTRGVRPTAAGDAFISPHAADPAAVPRRMVRLQTSKIQRRYRDLRDQHLPRHVSFASGFKDFMRPLSKSPC